MDRGKLRVYLGAAPGVGKTFAMLDEGCRRAARGTDVVVGWIDTHGRPKTLEAIGDLDVVPRRQVDHLGTVQEEFDLDAVLARRPTVVLVDELAHSNVPGSRNEKRWQDIEALLDAGIEVITTVNIQHLESLNDVTEAITGVRQRETVPDAMVRSADQIELVDMSPQSLRRRMAHGNIYAPANVDAALSNYFREGNLTALRELALLWLADRVDEGLDRYREQHDITGTWATRERIVVAVTGGPESITLMRRAARIASRRSGGEWLALYVARHDGLRGVSPDQLAGMRAKTDELGGTFHTIVGDDPAEAILAFARAENANQLIIGASRRSRPSSLIRPGIGERVVTASGEVDVLIVTHDYAGKRRFRSTGAEHILGTRRRLAGFAYAGAAPAAVSGILKLTGDHHGLPLESMALMAIVVSTALIGGLLPAVVSALWCGLLLNYLFTPPLHTLTIAEPSNAIAVVLFVIVGIAVATVVDHSARRAAEARRARVEADALTVLSHSLFNSSDDLTGLLASACEVFNATGGAILVRSTPASERGDHETVATVGNPPTRIEATDMSTAIDDETTLVLRGGLHGASERSLLNAYAAYAKVIAERQHAARAERDRSRLAEAERTRTALLAAVSHDLRSPLAAVLASVATLRNQTITLSPVDRADLLENIETSAEGLNALVTNLLDMSRIHAGAVTAHLTDVNLARAVHHALQPLAGSERITVAVERELIVLADPGLLDRVIANIAENALKYTPPRAVIHIDSAPTGAARPRAILRISDNGPGIPDHDQERIFAPFQRLGDVPQKDGIGLGLAVARGLTEAMGGTVTTEETPAGGLTFVLDLARPTEEPT